MIIISILAFVFFLLALIYVVREFGQRKKRCREKDYFEVYKDLEIFLVFLIIFSVMSAFFSCFNTFFEGGSILIGIICFSSQIIFSLLTINYLRPKIICHDKTIFILSFYRYKELMIGSIELLQFNIRSLVIKDKNNNRFRISNYCNNFEKLVEVLKKEKIKCNGFENLNIVKIRLSLTAKFFGHLLGLALIVAGILIIIFTEEGLDEWYSYCLIILGFVVFILFLITTVRWKIDFYEKEIFYTPLIGKRKTYSTRDIEKIHISTSYGCKGAKSKVIYITLHKKNIQIPYRFAGVQKLLEVYKHKITSDSE